MPVIEKAHELAISLAGSKDVLDYREAETRVMADPVARGLLRSYREAALNGNGNLDKLGDDVRENPLVNSYLDALSKVNQLIDSINFILRRAIDGEGETRVCGSCKGCIKDNNGVQQ